MLHVSGGVEVPDGGEHVWLTKAELAEALDGDGEMQAIAELITGPYP